MKIFENLLRIQYEKFNTIQYCSRFLKDMEKVWKVSIIKMRSNEICNLFL